MVGEGWELCWGVQCDFRVRNVEQSLTGSSASPFLSFSSFPKDPKFGSWLPFASLKYFRSQI